MYALSNALKALRRPPFTEGLEFIPLKLDGGTRQSQAEPGSARQWLAEAKDTEAVEGSGRQRMAVPGSGSEHRGSAKQWTAADGSGRQRKWQGMAVDGRQRKAEEGRGRQWLE